MTPEELAREKKKPQYKELRKRLIDPEWRIDNLYKIQDQHGNECLFKRNTTQRRYWANRHRRNVIPKARQLGMSTCIGVEMLDKAFFRKNTRCGIVDARKEDATKKLARIRFAHDRLPKDLRKSNPLTIERAEMLGWANGSSITVGTTYRGDTAQFLHVSEYGKISVDRPDQAKEIKTGAIRAVHSTGRVDIESTAHGTNGEFYDYVMNAKKLDLAGAPLTDLDFKLHFFAWWLHPEYVLPANLVVVTVEMKQYFDELLHKHGIKLTANQCAWYVKMYEELGPDDMLSEYPSTLEEAFFNSLKGTYYKTEINRARKEQRIGAGAVPHDPTKLVNTTWDIGEDCTVIAFHQTDGLRHRWIDYWEMEGSSLQEAAAVLEEKKRTRGFLYGVHYGPHDFENREWGNRAKPRTEVAKELGIDIHVVERVEHKADSIDALRRVINFSWVCEVHCKRLVEGWESYRKKWNKALGKFEAEPVHDWASHIADAGQQISLELHPQLGEKSQRGGKRSRGSEPKGTAWGA